MTIDVRCSDPELFAAYLYDECTPAERLSVSAHLAACPGCAQEIAGLQETRAHLAMWRPPEARLGFRVVSEDAPDPEFAQRGPNPGSRTPDRTRHWWSWTGVPVWAQAAAGVLLFVFGAAMANVRVSYDGSGVTLRLGAPDAGPAASRVSDPAGTAPASARDLAALEARMRQEIARVRTSDPAALTADAAAPAAGDVLGRVREMLAQSEQRQQREMTLRLADVLRDVDAQHNVDLSRIERTVGQMEGVTGEEVQQQRQMLNYLMRVSQQPR